MKIRLALAIFLVVSLGITMVPPQSVEAQPPAGKFTFDITAKGQGDWKIDAYQSGTGEFSVRIVGEASKKGSSYGYGNPPEAEVGGHVVGSFDSHTISVGLRGHLQESYGHVPISLNEEWNGILRLIQIHGLKVRGKYDSEPINTGGGASHVAVYDNDSGIRIIEVLLTFPGLPDPYLHIWMYETEADIFKVKIREFGN